MDKDNLECLLIAQNELNNCIKFQSPESILRRAFIEYFNQLQSSIYKAQVIPISDNCIHCGNHLFPSTKIPLSCNHYICTGNCYNTLIKSQIDGNLSLYNQLACPCGAKIPKTITTQVFGGEEIFTKTLIATSVQFEPMIVCNICGENYRAGEFITLDCDHRYCKTCITSQVKILVDEGKVGNEISCPECQKPVEPLIIFNILDPETKDKYDKFLLRSLEGKKGEVFISCVGKPGVECEFGQFVSVDRVDYTCPVCGANFCPKCKEDVHLKITCEDQKIAKKYKDLGIEEFIKNGTMQFCPWCTAVVEKNDGCKYITCKSNECKSVRFFCWDCRTKLKVVHEEHKCTTKDVISNRIKRWFKNIFSIK